MSTVVENPDSQVPPVYVDGPWPRRPASPPPTVSPTATGQNDGVVTCLVRAIVNDSVDGTPVLGATIEYKLTGYDVDEGYVAPLTVEVTTDQFGEAFVNLWPNELGSVETVYSVKITANGKTLRTTAVVPNVPEADLHLIAQLPPWPGQSQGAFLTGEFYGWMVRAEAAAEAADESAQASAGSAVESAASADESEASALAAAQSAVDADASADAAHASELAAANSASAAATSAFQADQAKIAAQAAQAAAEAAAQLAQGANTYNTLAEALAAGLTPPKHFFVRQGAAFPAVYEFEKTATNCKFIGMRLSSSKGALINSQRALRGTLSPNVTGLLFDVWGSDAWEWDGRVVPNRLSAVLPTLNIFALPFNSRDELQTTPAREPSTPATTDSAGTNFAMKITSSAQNQQLTIYRTSYGTIPSDTYRMRVEAKQLPGGVAATKDQWRLGHVSTGLLVQPNTATWTTTYETSLAAFTGANDIGFGSAVGNTDGVVAIANLSMYDPLAGESAALPTFQQELAAQGAGHMKSVLSTAGKMSLTQYGSVNIDGTALGSHVISFTVNPIQFPNGYTFGCWMESTEVPAGTFAIAYSFDRHNDLTNGAAGTTHGMFGVYGAGNANTTGNVQRLGKIYVNPNVGALAATPCANHYLPNQGKKFFALSIIPSGTGYMETIHVNEVPVPFASNNVYPNFVVPQAQRMLVGAWNGSDELHKVNNPFKGNGTGFFFKAPAMSQAQIRQRGQYMDEALRLDGDTPAPRLAAFIANGDSLSAFTPSYIFKLSDCTALSPRLDLFNVAEGGTDIGAALAEPRKTIFKNMISAAVAAGYKKVPILARWFTNEHNVGDPYSWISNKNHIIWRDQYYLPFMAELKALGPGIVEIWHVTGPYRLGLAAQGMTEWDVALMDQNANDDFRDNYKAYGLDRLIDLGLGTERCLTTPYTFAPETRPGGRVMANWRCENAHMNVPVAGTPSRAPAGALNLSAQAGAAITATANAGTFLFHDLYRKIVAGATGYGRIVAISADGAQATLDTTNRASATWPGEPALVTTRDSVTRGAGYDALGYANGAWTIASCPEEWQTDGIHQSEFGGRQECDFVWPTIQQFLNGL